MDNSKNIECKVLEIIQKKVNEKASIEIDKSFTLSNAAIDSLMIVKIIVEIEETYGFEFEDEKLSREAFPNVVDIIEYVQRRIGSS